MVRTDFGGADSVSALALQRDGKIVAVGAGKGDFALARYLPNGRIDRSFGTGGTVRTDFGGKDSASAVVIDGHGRILVAGTGKRQAKPWLFALARYRGDGSLDPSFGNGGKVVTTFPTLPHDSMGIGAGATAVGLQKDGRIVAAGYSRLDAVLARYTPHGRIDPSFGKDGRVVTHPGDLAYADWMETTAAEIQPDGKIVAALLAGVGENGGTVIVRFTRDGSLDAGFGRRGVDWGGATGSRAESVGSIAIQRNGKIVAGGADSPYRPDEYLFVLKRYTRAGHLDKTFDRDGRVVTGFGEGQWFVQDIAIQPDGKIIAVGSEPWTMRESCDGQTFAAARYLPTGRLDTRFGKNGKVLSGSGCASAVLVQPDGKIVVAGQTASGHDFLLIRYRSNGRLDT